MSATLTAPQVRQRQNNVKRIAETRRATETCGKGHRAWKVRPDDGTRYCRICKTVEARNSRDRARVALIVNHMDPRHGTPTGFRVGCRCHRCSDVWKTLSPYQLRILDLIVDGCANKEIAVEVGSTEKAIVNQTSAIYRKLGVRNRPSCVTAAFRAGLVQ